MSNTGKSVAAITALAVVLGFGWWALDRSEEDAAKTQTALSGTTEANGAAQANALDPQWLAEMHASLRLLSESLAMTGNLGGAIAFIDVLDARAARQPPAAALASLRASLAADRQKLIAAKSVDITASAAIIDQLVASVDAMQLLSAPTPLAAAPRKPAAVDASAAAFDLDAMMQAIRARFADVVRIRKIENPEAVFLTPEQGALVAERLRLRLLSARIALVSRQEQMFAQDIAMAERILATAFDPQDAEVTKAKASLASLKALGSRLAIPMQLQSLAVAQDLQNNAMQRP